MVSSRSYQIKEKLIFSSNQEWTNFVAKFAAITFALKYDEIFKWVVIGEVFLSLNMAKRGFWGVLGVFQKDLINYKSQDWSASYETQRLSKFLWEGIGEGFLSPKMAKRGFWVCWEFFKKIWYITRVKIGVLHIKCNVYLIFSPQIWWKQRVRVGDSQFPTYILKTSFNHFWWKKSLFNP